MRVDHTTNFFGEHLTDVRSNASGIILYMIGTPPVQKDEMIVRIIGVGSP